MQAIMLGIIVILLCTSVYFAYRYFLLKRHSYINNDVINEMKKLMENNSFYQTDGKQFDSVFHEFMAFINHIKENFLSFTNIVKEKGGELAVHGEYAAEKADIVRAAIDEVGIGLQKQLAAIEESTVSMEDMTVAIEDLSIRSNQISEQSNTTLHLTQQGDEKLKTSIEKMEQFNQTINTTFDAIKTLGERSHEIGMIVKVITGISEQINLLALNAAIEAARAGEHGKGFAVVADEVRKLAGQSSASAFEVSNIVKNIQEETTKVVKSMSKGTEEFSETHTLIFEVGAMFEKIVSSTKVIADNNINSSASTEELSSGSQQIMAAVKEIEFISRESVEMFEELVGISDDELQTMEKLLYEAKNLVASKNETEKLLYSLNHSGEAEEAESV